VRWTTKLSCDVKLCEEFWCQKLLRSDNYSSTYSQWYEWMFFFLKHGVYYGLEAWLLNKSQIKSLEFTLNSVSRKIFVTTSYDVANESIVFFKRSVSDAMYKRKIKFLTKLQNPENIICKLFEKKYQWLMNWLMCCMLTTIWWIKMIINKILL